MYANFNRYDNKGRRLSLFAEEENNKLKIYVTPALNQISFVRKMDGVSGTSSEYLAGDIQENDLEELFVPHPQVFEIAVIDNKPKKTLSIGVMKNF